MFPTCGSPGQQSPPPSTHGLGTHNHFAHLPDGFGRGNAIDRLAGGMLSLNGATMHLVPGHRSPSNTKTIFRTLALATARLLRTPLSTTACPAQLLGGTFCVQNFSSMRDKGKLRNRTMWQIRSFVARSSHSEPKPCKLEPPSMSRTSLPLPIFVAPPWLVAITIQPLRLLRHLFADGPPDLHAKKAGVTRGTIAPLLWALARVHAANEIKCPRSSMFMFVCAALRVIVFWVMTVFFSQIQRICPTKRARLGETKNVWVRALAPQVWRRARATPRCTSRPRLWHGRWCDDGRTELP